MLEITAVNYWTMAHPEAGGHGIQVNVSPEKQPDAMARIAKERIQSDREYMRAQEALMKLRSHRVKMRKYEESQRPRFGSIRAASKAAAAVGFPLPARKIRRPKRMPKRGVQPSPLPRTAKPAAAVRSRRVRCK